MNKRLFTFVMAIIMIFSVCTTLPVKISVPLQADAVTDVSNLYPVNSTYSLIKVLEDCDLNCFWDVAQWTIGYGNKCPYAHTSNGTYWHQSGGHSISESEARNLFNSKLSDYVNILKSNCRGLAMTQNQFDALLSATYNHGNVLPNGCEFCGYKKHPLIQYLLGNLTESQAREQYYVWCINVGTKDEKGLRNRRKKEADVFFSDVSNIDNPWHKGLTPVDIGDDWYGYIINSKEWKHLTNDNTNADFKTQTGAKNQLWKFTKNNDGSYTITSLADGNVLDVANGSSTNGANVGLYESHGSDNQKWYIYGSSEQHYLRAVSADSVLDLSGGNFYEGVNAQMWEKNDSDAQKFHLWELKKSAELNVDVKNSAGKTTFSWNSLEIADHYDVKIWNGTYWNGECTYSDFYNKGTSSSFTLPAGHYEAYVDTVTYDGSIYMSNVVKFDVKDETFNVAFNANGGSVSTENKTVTYNSTYGSLPTPTRTGYSFNGWYTAASGGSEVNANTKVTITTNHTLYAHWTAKSVSVKFHRNLNGNDTESVTEKFIYNTSNQKFGYKTDGTARYSPTNPANVGFGAWSKTGYEMLGWSVDKNAKSAEYSTYSGVSNNWINSNSPSTNLYAVWKAKQYNVKLVYNDGTDKTENIKVTYDGTYSGLTNPTRTGYNFNGWFTSTDGGTQIAGSNKVSITSDQTLYAYWSKDKIMITFDAVNGTAEGATKLVTYDNKYGVLPKAEKTGYTFDGWYLDKEYTKPISETDIVKITSNQSVYAKWTLQEYTITFDGNGGTPDVKTKRVVYGKIYGVLPEAVMENDTFAGWFTADGTEIKSDDIVKIESDITVYAKWQSEISGDVNLDGTIDTDDAILLNDYLLGRKEFTKEQAEKADITGDNIIDVFDLVAMRSTLVERNDK